MHRRRYLGVIGLVTLGGCTGGDTNADQTTAPAPATRTPTSTPTDTTAITTTTTTTPTRTETETETPTDTPDPNVQQARDRLDQAREYLNRAVEEYVARADSDDPSILDANAAVKINVNDVIGWTNNAREQIDVAEDISNGKISSEVETMREAYLFLEQGARLQYRLWLLYETVQEAITVLKDEEWATVLTEAEGMADHVDNARGFLLNVTTDSSAPSMEVLDAVSADQHGAKIDQWKAEIDAFAAAHDALVDLADGLETMTTATLEYFDDDVFYTGFSPGVIESASETLGGAPRPDSIAEELDDLHSLANNFADAAAAMDNAAAARENGNDDAAGRQECDARDAVMDYDDWRDFSAADRIFANSDCSG